jgi:hypothetical protein
MNITNDQIAERAMELAKAEGTIVWQREKYIMQARKQLETEAEAKRPAPRTTPVFSDAELVKAQTDKDGAILDRGFVKCV